MTFFRAALMVITCLVLQPFAAKSQSFTEHIQEMVNDHVTIDSVHNFLKLEKSGDAASFDVIRRTIDGGHSQLIAGHYHNKTTYNLLLQSDSSGIYLAVVNTIRTGKTTGLNKNKLFYTDPARLNHFIVLHDSIYGSSLTTEDFKHFVMNRYGRACGYAGMPTPQYSRMMQFLNAKDVATLRGWLKMPDYETKVIAATGLLALQMQNTVLTIDDLLVIDHLRRLDIPINYCSGCTVWFPSRSSALLHVPAQPESGFHIRFLQMR